MARIGYARVSSTDQDLALQIERLIGLPLGSAQQPAGLQP